jgi:hypothetical protein
MGLNKIILMCILLVGCEKEPIKLESPKILKKYQYEVKTISKPNSKKHRLGKRTFCLSKILKRKNKKT